MLLTLSTTYQPATDLGYLLHKNPSRLQSFSLNSGKAHVFYSNRAMAIYEALHIRKERIDPRQKWHFYAEQGLAKRRVQVRLSWLSLDNKPSKTD